MNRLKGIIPALVLSAAVICPLHIAAMDNSLVGVDGTENSVSVSGREKAPKDGREESTGGTADSGQAQSILEGMSREEKIGQMLMVSPSQLSGGDWTQDLDQVLLNIDFYHIGAVIFLQEDLEYPEASEKLQEELADREGIKTLIVTDASGSRSAGLDSPQCDAVLALAGTEETEDALIVSDSLTLTERQEGTGVNVAVTRALQEGNDLLSTPSDVMTAYYGMLSALDEQLVTEEQIDRSVLKILNEKIRLGLM